MAAASAAPVAALRVPVPTLPPPPPLLYIYQSLPAQVLSTVSPDPLALSIAGFQWAPVITCCMSSLVTEGRGGVACATHHGGWLMGASTPPTGAVEGASACAGVLPSLRSGRRRRACHVTTSRRGRRRRSPRQHCQSPALSPGHRGSRIISFGGAVGGETGGGGWARRRRRPCCAAPRSTGQDGAAPASTRPAVGGPPCTPPPRPA